MSPPYLLVRIASSAVPAQGTTLADSLGHHPSPKPTASQVAAMVREQVGPLGPLVNIIPHDSGPANHFAVKGLSHKQLIKVIVAWKVDVMSHEPTPLPPDTDVHRREWTVRYVGDLPSLPAPLVRRNAAG